MRKEVAFKNRDRFIQLGIAIASLRKLRGMSQEALAEKAGISRSLLSVIEAPNTANSFRSKRFMISQTLSMFPRPTCSQLRFFPIILSKKNNFFFV